MTTSINGSSNSTSDYPRSMPASKLRQYGTKHRIAELMSTPPKSVKALQIILKHSYTPETALALSDAFYRRAIDTENLHATGLSLELYKTVHADIRRKEFQFSKKEHALLDEREKLLKAKYQEESYERFRANDDVHIRLIKYLSIKDSSSYLEAMNLSTESCTFVKNTALIEALDEYCKAHPKSFLALVCKPAIERACKKNGKLTRADAFHEVLQEYLGKRIERDTMPEDTLYECLQKLETFYVVHLHFSYCLFFTAIFMGYSIDEDLELRSLCKEKTSHSLTIEDVGLIIEKFHQSQTQNFLKCISYIALRFSPFADKSQGFRYIPPELKLFLSVTRLHIDNFPLPTIDLKPYPLLRRLEICSCSISSLDVSSLQNLEYLDVSNNLLTSLDVRSNHKLEAISASRNPLPKIDLSFHPSLSSIVIDEDTVLDYKGIPSE